MLPLKFDRARTNRSKDKGQPFNTFNLSTSWLNSNIHTLGWISLKINYPFVCQILLNTLTKPSLFTCFPAQILPIRQLFSYFFASTTSQSATSIPSCSLSKNVVLLCKLFILSCNRSPQTSPISLSEKLKEN